MPDSVSLSSNPFVSVCIPAYNADCYLDETLRSVASQRFRDWEIIVTEDGSKDRAEHIVKAFARRVSQPVFYERHATNRGLPATRNTGIVAARGKWIALLDADDLWTAEHLEKLVQTAQAEDCDVVYSGSILYDDTTGAHLGTREPSAADLADLPVALYTGRLSIMPSSVMIRRDAFSRFGPISAEFPICNDTEYWLRILSMGGRMCYSGANTCVYRQHASSMSRKAVAILAESARLCERYATWEAIPAALARARPASLYRWAARTLLPDDPAGAASLLSHAFRLQPFSAKTVALWAKALLNQNAARRSAA